MHRHTRHKIRTVVKAHVKRHAHGYGIVAALFTVRLIPMFLEFVTLVVADITARKWFGGHV